jgi:hypothetical protein
VKLPDPSPWPIAAGIIDSVDHRSCRPPELKRTTPSVHLRERYGYREDRR